MIIKNQITLSKCFVLKQQVVAKRNNNNQFMIIIYFYITVLLIVMTIGKVIGLLSINNYLLQ